MNYNDEDKENTFILLEHIKKNNYSFLTFKLNFFLFFIIFSEKWGKKIIVKNINLYK